MQPKFISLRYARKWYDIGAQYRHLPTRRTAINAAIDDGHAIDCWEAAAAFGAGYRGLPFEVKTWRRYGPIPLGHDGYAAPSVNHADGETELGVSTADKAWEQSIRGTFAQCRSRKVVEFHGVQVGIGSDGEPVVLPVQE